MLWCAGAAFASGLPHPTAIERQVSPERFTPRTSGSGGYVYPGYFNKIRNGTKVPGIGLVEKVERLFPGTRYWYDHPFWDTARHPLPWHTLQSVLGALSELQSDSARSLIFHHKRVVNPDSISDRATYLESVLSQLEREGDWDALTAVIGFVQTERDPPLDVREQCAPLILRIFERMSSESPFFEVFEELYNYIKMHFLDVSDRSNWLKEINPNAVKARILVNRTRLRLIDDLGLLRTYRRAPPSCLHIAERYLPPSSFPLISKCDSSRDKKDLIRFPGVQNLADALRQWESRISQPSAS